MYVQQQLLLCTSTCEEYQLHYLEQQNLTAVELRGVHRVYLYMVYVLFRVLPRVGMM